MKKHVNSDLIKVENAMDILIVLLYAPGRDGEFKEPIDGITRLQKLIFLLQQDIGPKQVITEAIELGYKPYKMGPYSKQLNEHLEVLISVGILKRKKLEYWLHDDADLPIGTDLESEHVKNKRREVVSNRFSLTDDLGDKVGLDLWKGLSKDQRKQLKEFKSFFNSLSLRQLLIFTYERYPKYTTESAIKDQLNIS